MKRFWIRCVFVVLLAAVAIMLYKVGKGRMLLLDNQRFETERTVFEPLFRVTVTIDDQKTVELLENDRDRLTVMGKKRRIKIVWFDEEEGQAGSLEKRFEVGDHDVYLLNIPALANGYSGWIKEFGD